MRFFKLLLRLSLFGFILAAIGAWFVYQDYQTFLAKPLALPSAEIELTIARGWSVNKLAQQLKQQGIIEQPWYVVFYARWQQLASKIKAGDYQVKQGTTLPQLMEQIVAGRVVQYALTIPEGWTFKQMLQAVREHPQLQQTLQSSDGVEIMAQLGAADQHPEGQFFPDTYLFPRGTSDIDFLRRAYQTMQKHVDTVWQQRKPDIPLQNAYQALILASVIERETGLASERREIAGVFTRRLNKKMRLQTDPTVIYGLGDEFDGNLTRKHLRTDTPYNTYTRAGLPPTPIALPGLEALRAAVDPAAGKTLYFVATGDGGHVFSETLREHNRAVNKYQR